jgi:hypothetical protein
LQRRLLQRAARLRLDERLLRRGEAGADERLLSDELGLLGVAGSRRAARRRRAAPPASRVTQARASRRRASRRRAAACERVGHARRRDDLVTPRARLRQRVAADERSPPSTLTARSSPAATSVGTAAAFSASPAFGPATVRRRAAAPDRGRAEVLDDDRPVDLAQQVGVEGDVAVGEVAQPLREVERRRRRRP